MIPKKIHYCWFGRKPFPELVKKCIETWKQHLPDYEFCLWNEQNSPMDVPFVKEAYTAKKYAFVADYVRFWALYNHGGIYLDTDMYVIRSFDDLLNNECFFAWETKDKNVLSCGIIGCTIENLFIDRILMKYNSLNFNPNNLSEFIIPRLITPIYEEYDRKEEIKIYDYDYFYPFPFSERKKQNFLEYMKSNTYAIHLWNISWYPWYKKLIRDMVIYLKRLF